jgi:hypothetical protein
MTDTSKPIVRLETSSAAKKAQKKAVAEAKEQTIKLAIRLNEGINEALRTLIRYRGDLSTMALEALDAVDLTRAALVSTEERMVRDTTITMPRPLHKKLKRIADDRDSSMKYHGEHGLGTLAREKRCLAARITRRSRSWKSDRLERPQPAVDSRYAITHDATDSPSPRLTQRRLSALLNFSHPII